MIDRPILLLDLDGVIVDLPGGIRKEYKELTGDDLGPMDSFRFEDSWPEAPKGIFDDIMHKQGFFRNLMPEPGAIEALKIIEKMEVDFFICTAPKRNSTYCVGEKWEWVQHYLGNTWTDKFIACHEKTLVYGDILLDDEPNKDGLVDPQWLHVIFDQTYNRDVAAWRPRVNWYTWPEIFLYWKEHVEKGT